MIETGEAEDPGGRDVLNTTSLNTKYCEQRLIIVTAILLLNHILHVDEVIEVEKYPGDVTEDEDNDDADEDEGKVDLTSHSVGGSLVGVSEIVRNKVIISN